MKDKNIAVIGAGPMGLAVAYQLALNGYKPIIFESDDRVGGMTATFDFNGKEIERYYHFHCTSDYAFFEVLKELNIDHKLKWVSTKMGYWHQQQLQPWGNPFALLSFKGLGLIAKIRYGLHAFLAVKRNNWQVLEKQDAVTWIKKWVGTEAFNVLWKNLFDLKFYHYSENLSAPWIWSRIRRIGRSRYNIFKEQLGYLEGGSHTLLAAMKSKIEELGGEFHLKTAVTKISMENNQVNGLYINDKFLAFTKVISTIPLPIVARIASDLPEPILEKYRNKKNIAVVCLIAKLKKPLTENFWLNTNDPNMDIPGIIEYGNLNPESGHIVYVPYYMPRENPQFQDADDIFINKVKTYFQTINPTMTDDDIEAIKVHRYHFAQPICEPNFLETLPKENIANGLWIADTSYYYPEDRGISESIGYGRAMALRAIS